VDRISSPMTVPGSLGASTVKEHRPATRGCRRWDSVGPATPCSPSLTSVGVKEQEVGNLEVVDAAAPVTRKGVQAEHVLRVVVGDGFQGRVFTPSRLGRGSDGGGDLDVDRVVAPTFPTVTS
jgi:hypothetical protein